MLVGDGDELAEIRTASGGVGREIAFQKVIKERTRNRFAAVVRVGSTGSRLGPQTRDKAFTTGPRDPLLLITQDPIRRRHDGGALHVGKFGIGFYLGGSGLTPAYGAAGSIVVLIVWVYYLAQIFYLGAEFTKAYARAHGSHPTARGFDREV